jgi:MoxR-like ATPase
MVDFKDRFDRLADNIGLFVHGKDKEIRLALVCLFAQGHLLIEGVPGVAKTSLAKAIANSIEGVKQGRIQFTPDLLPSDVTGSRVFRQGREASDDFEPGPVFSNILLGDEINRASPKTQSALLEVMAERQVTVDGHTRAVPRPFMCIATQNPIEHHGTYPLPEAQIDRFMMLLRMGYPDLADEIRVVAEGMDHSTPDDLVKPVMNVPEVEQMIAQVRAVTVTDVLKKYIVQITSATRDERSYVRLGVSPRGSVALVNAAQAYAAAQGREYARADDVKAVAVPVLSHRLLLTPDAPAHRKTSTGLIEEILAGVPVPRDPGRSGA